LLLSGRRDSSATYQSHLTHTTATHRFPSHLDKDRIQRLSFGTLRTDWKRSLPASPKSDRSVLVCHQSSPKSQSVQSTLYHCCYQPIETRSQPWQTASYAPVPTLPDPASVSIVSSPHRMLLQQSWRAWLGRLVEVWLWGSY
jgi:hypothetical protein